MWIIYYKDEQALDGYNTWYCRKEVLGDRINDLVKNGIEILKIKKEDK